MRLSLRLNVTHGQAQPPRADPLEYSVRGLPPGETARIRDFTGDRGWRVHRMKRSLPGRWEGRYQTAEEALTALEDQVSRETPTTKRTSYSRRRLDCIYDVDIYEATPPVLEFRFCAQVKNLVRLESGQTVSVDVDLQNEYGATPDEACARIDAAVELWARGRA